MRSVRCVFTSNMGDLESEYSRPLWDIESNRIGSAFSHRFFCLPFPLAYDQLCRIVHTKLLPHLLTTIPVRGFDTYIRTWHLLFPSAFTVIVFLLQLVDCRFHCAHMDPSFVHLFRGYFL